MYEGVFMFCKQTYKVEDLKKEYKIMNKNCIQNNFQNEK